MIMELLLKLIFLVSLQQFMVSGSPSFSNELMDNETYISSAQIKALYEEGDMKSYFRSLNREMDIIGFICACALIREANNVEFRAAKLLVPPGLICKEIWMNYFETCTDAAAMNLRGSKYKPGLLSREKFSDCATSLCSSYDICSKHIHGNLQTVQVLNQYRAGTTKTIVQILEEEKPRYLLSVNDMTCINIFMKASGQAPFRFIRFRRYTREMAIPKVRNASDRIICPSFFRRPTY